MIDECRTEVELRWRPSALTRAAATCAAVTLAVAVVGSYWQLIAFAAPLVGMLVSISWQRPAPKLEVLAQPASQRCFESEQTRLTISAEIESDDGAIDLARCKQLA